MADPGYFTLAELRALPDMSAETEPRILAAAAWAVGIIERECRTSFVARTVTDEEHDGDGDGDGVVLDTPYVLSVTSVKENGVVVTDTLRAKRGVLRRYGSGASTPGRWSTGVGNVLVTYQAGYSATPPADVKEAALVAARWHLLETRASNVQAPRQTSISNEMGGTTTFALADEDHPTGYPDVDAVIVGWRKRLNTVTYP